MGLTSAELGGGSRYASILRAAEVVPAQLSPSAAVAGPIYETIWCKQDINTDTEMAVSSLVELRHAYSDRETSLGAKFLRQKDKSKKSEEIQKGFGYPNLNNLNKLPTNSNGRSQ